MFNCKRANSGQRAVLPIHVSLSYGYVVAMVFQSRSAMRLNLKLQMVL